MPTIVVEITSAEQKARWSAAASAAGITLGKWIGQELDAAGEKAFCKACGRKLPRRRRTGRPRTHCPGLRGGRCRKQSMEERRAEADAVLT